MVSETAGGRSLATDRAKGVPKWQSLYEALRRQILSGAYQLGQELPAQHVLARDYGVSVTTAREATAGLVQDGLVIRVQGRGTFVKDRLPAQALKVEVLTPCHRRNLNVKARDVISILAGVSEAARETEIDVRLRRITNLSPPEAVKEAAPALEEADGAIILREVTSDLHAFCRREEIPFVLADGHFLTEEVPQVSYNRRRAARLATEYICRGGHSRVALMGATSDIPHTLPAVPELQRVEGFLDTIRQCHLGIPAGYLVQCRKEFGVIRQATRELLGVSPRPTAICCTTDRIASAVLTVLLEENIRVPEQIALIAFTDAPASAGLPVPLSGVYQPFEEIGVEAVNLLRRMVAGRELPELPVLVEPRLVLRASTEGPDHAEAQSAGASDYRPA